MGRHRVARGALLHGEAVAPQPGDGELQGPLTSAGYLELTVSWLRRFGFTVEETPSRFTVTAHQPSAHAPPMPGDWSSLGYLLLIAWRTGGSVERADPSSAHPDQALLRLIQPAGLTPVPGPDLTMRVEGQARDGLTASGKECPDLLPTLAALACVLPRPSTLHDVSILRLKESDRLEGIRTLVSAYGGIHHPGGRDADDHPSAHPSRALRDGQQGGSPARHGVRHALHPLGSPADARRPECVEKSFPGFWRQVERVGVRLTE